MTDAKQQHQWASMLKFFSEQNFGRLTRLGVFEGGNDFWLESGLPLTGIDVDVHAGRQTVEIVLGDFTHITKDVKAVKFILSHTGEEDGVDVEDFDGKTTVLRFEAGR
ncbi:MAG: DUF5335 family protein [Pyrinomonadaceae bacterium]|nr:DUF5335 family protein [Pyrinomonadaceae bacterium]